MKKTIKSEIKTVKCSICGKESDPSKCFRTKLPKKFFYGWTYQLNVDTLDFKDVQFKNKWYKIIGYTKVQREIVYFIWKMFHWKTEPYIECSKCLKKR